MGFRLVWQLERVRADGGVLQIRPDKGVTVQLDNEIMKSFYNVVFPCNDQYSHAVKCNASTTRYTCASACRSFRYFRLKTCSPILPQPCTTAPRVDRNTPGGGQVLRLTDPAALPLASCSCRAPRCAVHVCSGEAAIRWPLLAISGTEAPCEILMAT